MKKLNRVWLISTLGLMSSLSIALPGLSQPTVRLQTDPSLDQVLPSQDLVGLTLQAVDGAGLPLQKANIKLRLLTPAKTPWFTSDFPIVEGTKLLEFDAIAAQGALQFQQVLPIRGTYQLQVHVTPQESRVFSPFQQTLTFSVPENPVKYRNGAILAAILLMAGLGGGWLMGSRQTRQPGETVPRRVRLLFSGATAVAIIALLTVSLSAEFAKSTHAHRDSTPATPPTVRRLQGLEVRLSSDTQAIVGKAATLAVQVTDTTTNRPATDVILNVQAEGLEDHELVFAYQSQPDGSGQFTWQQQFYDGAPHELRVGVAPQANSGRQFTPFEVAKEITVEGVTPPLPTRLITLGYFTSIIALGVGAGVKVRRQWV